MPEQAVQRKLTAILAADIAGYSRLVGLDEEGTLARLKALRRELIDPTIAEHRGRIVKTTGDGMLVEFASVVDAVRCAIAVQRATADRETTLPEDRRIQFRVGINLGDIVVEGDDILGDGVNVAARLEGIAEPDGICISAAAYEQVRGKVDFDFADLGEQKLKNIVRPVRAYRVLLDQPLVMPTAGVLPIPDKPSIAVLPFINLSNDPEQEFLADGIAEDVITALSRYPALFVIARNSCFTYKGRAVEVRQIGCELGVRYVLEGSLRKAENRIRVTAQLVEAGTGNHVWAERYDRDLADIFAVQDEIAQAVTIAIAPAVAQAESQRAMRKPPENLDAWAAYQRGLWYFSRVTAEYNVVAEGFFLHAIALDPNFAGAYCWLGATQFQAAALFQTGLLAAAQVATEELARKAVALDGANAEARVFLSRRLMYRGDYAGALAEAEWAPAISPNLASAHQQLGALLVNFGRPAKGVDSLRTSLRLDPLDPNTALALNFLAAGLYYLREYETAVETAERAIRAYPDFNLNYRWLAAALGQTGRPAEAKQALDKAIAVAPASFDMYARNRVPWVRPEDHAHMLEGLRKAGWEG